MFSLRQLASLTAVIVLGTACSGGADGVAPIGRDSTANIPTKPSPPAQPEPEPSPILVLPLSDRIVYASNSTDSLGDIYAMKLDGSDPVRITGVQSGETCPVVSPDGNRIAYVRISGGFTFTYPMATAVSLMNADGTNRRLLRAYPTQGYRGCPLWSNDGTKLVVAQSNWAVAANNIDAPVDVFTFDSTGSLINSFSRVDVLDLALSPDGTRILFASYGQSGNGAYNYRVHSVKLDGSDDLDFGPGAAPQWSPATNTIFFTCYDAQGVCTAKPDATARQRWSAIGAVPIISMDGTRVSYECSDTELCNSDVSGAGMTKVTFGSRPGLPWWLWMRDGHTLAFECVRGDICLTQPDGSGLVNLTRSTSFETRPSFSPISTR